MTLLGFWAVAGGVLAQSANHMRFTRAPNLVTDDPSIVSMLQDRQGFIWLGALNGGLYRYDGSQAIKFVNNLKDEKSLPGERVNALFEDKTGAIWAGTTQGLARFNPETSKFTRYVSSKAPGRHQVIRKIISDGKSGMWLATWGGLQHFDPATGHFRLYLPKSGSADSIGADSVEALALDSRHGLWIGLYPSGLDYLPAGSDKFKHFRLDSSANPDPLIAKVDALNMDERNRLWIGTRRGAYRWTDGSDWETRAKMPSPDVRINNFFPARDGGMWAVTMNDGLMRWSAKDEPLAYISSQRSLYAAHCQLSVCDAGPFRHPVAGFLQRWRGGGQSRKPGFLAHHPTCPAIWQSPAE